MRYKFDTLAPKHAMRKHMFHFYLNTENRSKKNLKYTHKNKHSKLVPINYVMSKKKQKMIIIIFMRNSHINKN